MPVTSSTCSPLLRIAAERFVVPVAVPMLPAESVPVMSPWAVPCNTLAAGSCGGYLLLPIWM